MYSSPGRWSAECADQQMATEAYGSADRGVPLRDAHSLVRSSVRAQELPLAVRPEHRFQIIVGIGHRVASAA